jgi:hypothetical protein
MDFDQKSIPRITVRAAPSAEHDRQKLLHFLSDRGGRATRNSPHSSGNNQILEEMIGRDPFGVTQKKLSHPAITESIPQGGIDSSESI